MPSLISFAAALFLVCFGLASPPASAQVTPGSDAANSGTANSDDLSTQQDKAVSTIVFGSCIKQDQPLPILERMRAEQPDLVLLTGDNIYADTTDISVMRAKYQHLASRPEFIRLREACPLLATWDDHDYGVNDGGADYAMREDSQAAMLDFLGVANDSPRRERKGVYHSEVMTIADKRLQVILLDTRYHRSPLKKGPKGVGGPYYPDSDPRKTMLGETQWTWLAAQFRVPADVRLVVSSIQFIASPAGQECWGNLPSEKDRMLNLIRETGARGVVFLSGDRHWSEISALAQGFPDPIYDITCSSLNQVHGRGTPTDNSFRVSKSTFHRENYGLLTIDWSGDAPRLQVSIRDRDGQERITQQWVVSTRGE